MGKKRIRAKARAAARCAAEQFVYDSVTLGKDKRCHVSMDSRITYCNNNHVVFGGTGAGKTTSIAIPMILDLQNTNIVAVFTKNNWLDFLTKELTAKGYSVAIVDFNQPEKGTHGFDPVANCHTDSDCIQLARDIVFSEGHVNNHDSFWDEQAVNMISIFLRLAKSEYHRNDSQILTFLKYMDMFGWYGRDTQEEAVTLAENTLVHKLVHKPCFGKKLFKFQFMEVPTLIKHHLPEEYERIVQYFTLNNDTGSSIAATTRCPVERIFNKDIRNLFTMEKVFDFKTLLKPKQAVLVRVNPVKSSNNGLISIFYQQLIQNLFEMAELQEDCNLQYPVQIFCDDFATGCTVPDFAKYISIFREKGVAATMLMQSESQLSALYGPNDATTIINNCDTYIYMGGNDLVTQQNVSIRTDMSRKKINTLGHGNMCFVRKGQEPFITECNSIFDNPVYQEYKAARNRRYAR